MTGATGTAPSRPPRTLIIACGALAQELLAVIEANGWTHMSVTCLPADLHNRPERIPELLRAKIRETRDGYDRVLALYGDCGTGGLLDAMLAEEGVARIPGAHCYEFYAGHDVFTAMHERDPGTFYLTDYLVRHFERLIIQGLGLDRHPELLPAYFGNYTRLVYLAQTEDDDLTDRAAAAARRLGLAFERHATGMGGLADFLGPAGGASANA